MGCVIIFTPPLRLQRQEPHIGLQAGVSCFGALNTMDKKRKYSELNSNGGGAIYVAAGLPPDLPLEIVRQIFEAFGKVESINVSPGVMAGQTLQEKESLVTVTFEQSDAEKSKGLTEAEFLWISYQSIGCSRFCADVLLTCAAGSTFGPPLWIMIERM